jgi:hypothetical protein
MNRHHTHTRHKPEEQDTDMCYKKNTTSRTEPLLHRPAHLFMQPHSHTYPPPPSKCCTPTVSPTKTQLYNDIHNCHIMTHTHTTTVTPWHTHAHIHTPQLSHHDTLTHTYTHTTHTTTAIKRTTHSACTPSMFSTART